MGLIVTTSTIILLASNGHAASPVDIGGSAFEARSITVEGTAVAIADLNGDGRLDVISANTALCVRHGDGTGRFADTVRAEPGEHPSDFAFGDFDADGDVDVVIANHDVHYVSILLSDEGGDYAPAEHSPMAVDVDPHPHSVRAADLDGDGRSDLLIDHSPRGRPSAALRSDPGGVLVMRGLDNARFETPGRVFAAGGVPYRGFEVGDINGDGRPDVVLPHDREVGILLNTSEDSRIAFERGVPVPADSPFIVKLGDVNADGRLDLCVAGGEDSTQVEIFYGNGQGGFSAAAGSPMHLGRGGKNMVIGDFNGDGCDDVAVSAYWSPQIMIVIGGRESLQAARVPAGHDHPWGLAAGDVNADGRDDLIVVGEGSRQGRLYLSRGKEDAPPS